MRNTWLRKIHRKIKLKLELLTVSLFPHNQLIKPDFLCIGAPRAATTWLHSRLSSHPEVYLPKIKELHFFDEPRSTEHRDQSGINWGRTHYFNMDSLQSWRWYSLQFQRGRSALKGDITPAYSTLTEKRVELIHQKLPGAKIIYILRDPVDRAWSGVRRSLWSDTNSRPSESVDILATVSHPEILIRGDYRRAITHWEKYYEASNILYLFFDDIIVRPREQLITVCDFLGISSDGLPAEKEDASIVNKSPEDSMPKEVQEFLSDYYANQLEFLEEKFDQSFEHWRY